MVDTEEPLPEINFDEDFSIDQNEESRQAFVQVDINPSLDESESAEEERKEDDYDDQEDDDSLEIDSDDEAEAELFALLLKDEIDNEEHHAERRSAFKIPVTSERRTTLARLINQHYAAMKIEEEEKFCEVQIVEEE